MKGWIKMFRQITDWELYKDINSKVLFLHLLLTAAYTDYTTSDGFVVHAGCCFTSIRQLADETGLSIRQVRTALERLEATHSLTQQTTHYNNKNNKKINNNIYVMPKKKKNSFLNYEQRDYDLNYIEQLAAEKNKIENLTAEDLEKIQKAID